MVPLFSRRQQGHCTERVEQEKQRSAAALERRVRGQASAAPRGAAAAPTAADSAATLARLARMLREPREVPGCLRPLPSPPPPRRAHACVAAAAWLEHGARNSASARASERAGERARGREGGRDGGLHSRGQGDSGGVRWAALGRSARGTWRADKKCNAGDSAASDASAVTALAFAGDYVRAVIRRSAALSASSELRCVAPRRARANCNASRTQMCCAKRTLRTHCAPQATSARAALSSTSLPGAPRTRTQRRRKRP